MKKKRDNIIPIDNEWSFEFIDDVYNEVERIGKEYLKLDIYPNQIEIISADQMIDAYASHGLPIMYNHWKFGKDYLINLNKYKKGMMGLAYEIVLNTNPCISFNMEDNTACMTTLVIAHAAMGHNHFFKNNYLFKQWTDASSIVDYLNFAKNYIKECEQKYGEKEVEVVLDACHALQYWGVDKYKRTYKSKSKERELNNKINEENDKLYDYLMERTAPIKKKDVVKLYKFPVQREENILYFVEKYAPKLESWKKEIIRITRKLSQYFMPQIQTKVLNEGCLVEGSLIPTEDGLLDIKYIVETKYSGKVWDGDKWEYIYDWFKYENKRRIKIKTDYGIEIFGGENHKILNNNEWIELNKLKIGDSLNLNLSKTGFNIKKIKIDYKAFKKEFSISDIEKICNISYDTYIHWKNGGKSYKNIKDLQKFELLYNLNCINKSKFSDNFISIPEELDDDLAYLLGLIIGDGCIDNKKRRVIFTNEDSSILNDFEKIVEKKFSTFVKTECVKNNTFNKTIHSTYLCKFLIETFNIKNGKSNCKTIPELILKSPKTVISEFIKGLFDTDGSVNNKGEIVFGTISEVLCKQVQEILFCFGILSKIRIRKNNFYEMKITGKFAKIFLSEIGFRLERKQNKLNDIISSNKYCRLMNYSSKIISIEEDFGTTYDFSVSNSHKYKSGAFINHNCATFVHYHILNKMFDEGLVDEGFMMEFLASHTSVVFQPEFNSPYYSGFNPYALGFAILMDIKRMCIEPTDEDREWFPDLVGKDWLEVFHDIIKNYKDETFILQFLSPKVIRDFKMFYLLDDSDVKNYVVKKIHNERGYREIREKLASTYNWSHHFPDIQVDSVDLLGDRKLKLVYESHNNLPLHEDMKNKTLKYLEYLWGYEVELSSVGLEKSKLEVEHHEYD